MIYYLLKRPDGGIDLMGYFENARFHAPCRETIPASGSFAGKPVSAYDTGFYDEKGAPSSEP